MDETKRPDLVKLKLRIHKINLAITLLFLQKMQQMLIRKQNVNVTDDNCSYNLENKGTTK